MWLKVSLYNLDFLIQNAFHFMLLKYYLADNFMDDPLKYVHLAFAIFYFLVTYYILLASMIRAPAQYLDFMPKIIFALIVLV